MNNEILEKINRRENQILLHSCLYYKFNDNLLTDHAYDNLGKDLIELSQQYPLEFSASYHYSEFKDYVTSECPSGYSLHYSTTEIVSKAVLLLRLYGRKTISYINEDSKIKK